MKKALAALFGFVVMSMLLAQTPGDIWGMVYNSVLPTLTDNQQTVWQSTINGQLNVTGLTPPVNCGVGATDLTASCTITVSLGLGP